MTNQGEQQYPPATDTDCECGGEMCYLHSIEDMMFDWQGEPERDDHGWPMWALLWVYTCSACGAWRRVFVRWIA